MFYFILLGCILLSFCIMWIINWFVHFQMTSSSSNTCCFGTFHMFVTKFNNYKDDPRILISKKYAAIWENLNNDTLYIWADIIKFDGTGMVLYPPDYLRFKIWSLRNLTDNNTQ